MPKCMLLHLHTSKQNEGNLTVLNEWGWNGGSMRLEMGLNGSGKEQVSDRIIVVCYGPGKVLLVWTGFIL